MSGFPAVAGDVVKIEVAAFPENETERVEVDGIALDGFLVLELDDDGRATERLFPWEGFDAGIYEVVEKA